MEPSRSAAARLRQLHWKACQLAEDKPGIITRERVINALESDLLHALANCLVSNAIQDFRGTRRRHKEIIDRFEDTLAAHSDRALCTAEICAAIGVQEPTLRVCCTEILGISAAKYMRLRRLNWSRAPSDVIWRARHPYSTAGRSIRGSCRNIHWTKFSTWL
jgi:AraC-like DNA-binding protein